MSSDCALPQPGRLAYAVRWSNPWERYPRNRQARSKAGLHNRHKNRLISNQDQLAPFVPGFARAFLATGELRLVAGRFRANRRTSRA